MPINNKLGSRLSKKELTLKAISENPGLEKETEDDIEQWRKMHLIRLGFGSAAWFGGIAALAIAFSDSN